MEDTTRAEPDVTGEQVLTWYRNMLTGKQTSSDEKLEIASLKVCSQHSGLNHVRGAETRSSQFLHGQYTLI